MNETPEISDTPPLSADTSSLNAMEAKNERRWMLRVAVATMALTFFPYFIGWSFAQGRQFMWLGYNLDDSCVYLSWMRQAADGSLRALNLFTTEPQHGMLLNPLFLVLGWIARLTGLPLILIYHISRLAFGFGLLVLVWRFIRATVADRAARRLAFLCVCFASGLGWLPGLWEINPIATPIDKWQPEAITYLSLLLSPLFCFSLALQIAVLTLLFEGERTGRIKYAVGAGVCGFVLGLTHTYDILSLSAVWVAYLSVTFIAGSRNAAGGNTAVPQPFSGSLLRAGIAGIITLPAVAYIYHELKTEAIFQQRANVETLSPSPLWLALGYGLTLCLALTAAYQLLRRRDQNSASLAVSAVDTPGEDAPALNGMPSNEKLAGENRSTMAIVTSASAARLLIVWAAVNVLVAYLPAAQFPFQRKMLQGAHFPIAILAGAGLAWLLALPVVRRQVPNRRLAVVVVLLLLGLTNVRFMGREITNYRDNHAQSGQRPYLNEGEIEALEWVRAHAPTDAAIQPLPWIAKVGGKLGALDMSLACFTPGLIHHPVYCGHWGETPDYLPKLQGLIRLMRPDLPDEQRRQTLRNMKVGYVIFSQKNQPVSNEETFLPFLGDPVSIPPYLTPVHSNHDADVYEVHLP